jgi:large subunit ribosomal protein L30
MFAVVRIRGGIKVNYKIKDTLTMLRLTRINHCVVVDKDPRIEGMIRKVKDFVTWGDISEETLSKLVASRGRMEGDKKLDAKQAKDVVDAFRKNKIDEVKGFKPLFRMSPPRKGYEGVKNPYPKGALGYRGEKINELLERMM